MKRIGITFILLSFLTIVMSQDLKQVVYNDGNQKLNGMITSNAGQDLPGVLNCPLGRG